ncbi:hypothetical protein GCM10023340_26310 [Nocardioides marinquilinus]|uniref:Lipoprotein n=1 Tax=Nocardioides marinquilinus TaxID=1210400 RepID=A0ABP9PPM3_9ACTN
MRPALAGLCLVLAGLAGCGGDEDPAETDGPHSMGSTDDRGRSVEATYDASGLTVVITAGRDVDLTEARTLYALVNVSRPSAEEGGYSFEALDPELDTQVLDAEGTRLACGESATVEGRTVTLVLPNRCGVAGGGGGRSAVLGSRVRIGNVELEATFRKGTRPVRIRTDVGTIDRA